MKNQSYSLTKTQKRVWFNSQLSGKDMPNIVMVFELTGDLDSWALRKALENLVEENSVLKSTIYSSADHLERIINSGIRGNLEIVDLTASEKKPDIFWMLHNIASIRFNLSTGPLFHFHLLKETDQQFYFTILIHPIIMDRYSLKYLVEQISRHYNNIIQNHETQNDNEELFDFNKIVEIEKKFNSSEKSRQGLTHWINTLKSNQFNLELPRKGYFKNEDYADSPFFEIYLNADLHKAVREFSKAHQVDYSVVLMAVYQALLYKYTDNSDVIINYSAAVTYNEKKVFGCLENRLSLRVLLNDDLSFAELVKLTKTQLLYDTYYKDIQINDIVKAVRDKYDSHFSGIFSNTSFDNNYLPYEQLNLGSVSVKLIPKYMKKFVPENLAIYYHDTGHSYSLIADFDEHIDSTAVRNFLKHYEALLKAFLENPDKKIAKQHFLTKKEYQKIIVDWNKTDEEYPHNFVHHLFENQVKINPDAVAIVYQDQQLTYAELNEKSNQLAHFISKQVNSIYPDQAQEKLVGICLERSLEMVISMIAILKAGAAYVPLDPSYPKDRLVYILEDTKIKIIISQEKVFSNLAFLADENRQIICLDSQSVKIKSESKSNLNVPLLFSNLAYIIYTSGSTGLPKGVMIEHQSFPNLLYGFAKNFKLSLGKRVLQFSSMNFDAVIPEIFSTLAYGATVFVVPEVVRQSADKLIDFLDENRITSAVIPPALLRILPRRLLPDLETLSFAGDVCDQETMDYWAKGRHFLNGYGPTECTVCATHGFLTPGDLPNRLGRPLPNYRTYILDKNLNPIPIGMIGELYIGGIGLARGYLNKPEMTAERFIQSPFGQGKIYKTGDQARYLPNSDIEYIGRSDFEVKIRGFRIQLSDIEHVLQLHPAIKQVTCKVWQKPGLEKVIAAYYVVKNNQSVSTNELRDHIQNYLPDYMLPGYFIELDHIVVSVNGKIDKTKLPDPFPQSSVGTIENREEQILKEIWTELFKLPEDTITANSDFFDLGGHSLLATQLASRIKTRTNVEVTIKDIFQYSQLKQIAKLIRESEFIEGNRFILEKSPEQDFYSALSTQLRLWYFYKTNPQSAAYNILFSVKFSNNVDVLALRKSIIYLLSHHKIFRTTFVEVNDDMVSKIHDEFISEIPLVDCATDQDLQNEIDKEKIFIFDLNNLPLVRCKLLLSESHGITLLFNVHHIVFDGASLSVMMHEIGEIYLQVIQHKKPSLLIHSIDYHDVAYSQNKWQKSGLFDEQLAYWQRKLHMPLPILELPTDFKRPPVLSYEGDSVRFHLPTDLVAAAKKIAVRNKTSLFSFLLSVYYILLHRITHQDDLIIASPIANRNQQELENILGMLANVVTYRVKFTDAISFDELLEIVNTEVIDAQNNQDIPFDMIVNQIQIGRDTSINPIFQTMFVLQSGFKLKNTLSDTEIHYEITEEHTRTSKFDISLIMYDDSSDNNINGYFEFNKALFRQDSISRYLDYFVNILRSVTNDPTQNIENIFLLQPDEYRTIIHDWNATKKEFPFSTIHREFENRALLNPQHIAVVYENEKITYDLLNKKANQLANYISQQYKLKMGRELSRDVFVGLCIDRGIEMVIALLAILKSGAAYLPLDPQYPKERLNYILDDSHTHIILTKKNILEQLDYLAKRDCYLLCIDSESADIEKQEKNNLTVKVEPTDLAYLIYTSGSTGRPKGVMIEHAGVINLAQACRDLLSISPDDNGLQFASINFDAAVYEIFQTLLNGACLFIVSEKLRTDPEKIVEFLAANNISYATLPPALLRILPHRSLPKLTRLGFAGDICDIETVSYWQKDRFFFNAYGPTEITVCATMGQLTENDSPHMIGNALNNYKIYVLDKNLRPVPVGVSGELFVGSPGLARGYLNRTDLTVERFIVNPFSDDPAERIYQTGDIVRWNVDGQLEYIGRSDFQVQIRGFRVELGEIEESLHLHHSVKQAAVTTVGEDINKKMIAYYTCHDNQLPITSDMLRKFLKSKLPEHMIPSDFICIGKMPLSPSDKIDKRALANMYLELVLPPIHYVAPRNVVEVELVEIWSELFNHQKIGVTDDFFSLGGNSLLSIRMLSKIKAKFSQEISLTQFFQYPTIECLSEIISGKSVREALDEVALAEMDAKTIVIKNRVKYTSSPELKHVLLTGSNGFLGVFLIRELLEQTTATIHCVIRGKNLDDIQNKLQKSFDKFGLSISANHPKINLIKGELTEKQVGIDDDQWKFLMENCDAIYHNGSLVNHIYTYQMLKPANVNSTIELIKLASTGKTKTFHYVSTLSAASQFDDAGITLEVGPSPKAIATGGYPLSKWVCENILALAAEQGLQVNIFRPGNITGDSKTGSTNFENNNTLLLLKSCIQLEVAPCWETYLEMTPVDMISRAIIKLSQQHLDTLQIHNLANHHLIKWSAYFKLIHSYGYHLKLISPQQWFEEYLPYLTENNALFPLKELYQAQAEVSLYGPDFKFENSGSRKLLSDLDIDYPDNYVEMINTQLSYLDKKGFFK